MRPYQLTRERADGSVPARQLGRGRPGKHIVHFPSLKNEGVIVCESRLEADFCLWLEYDKNVATYRPQPDPARLVVNESRVRYTPDFLSTSLTGAEKLWEIKPRGVYQWPAYLRKMAEASTHYRAQGRDFELVTDVVIRRDPHLRNLRWLYAQAHVVDPRESAHLWDILDQMEEPVTLGRLFQQPVPVGIRAIAGAVFHGELEINMAEPIGPRSLVMRMAARP
jgi:hypothetical protein